MDVTQFQIIEFGEVNFQSGTVSYRRRAKGAGIIFLNAVLPASLKVRFDDNLQKYTPVPRTPIYYNFNQSVTLEVTGAFGGNATFTQIVTPRLKALVIPEKFTGNLTDIPFEPSFKYSFNLGVYAGTELIQFKEHIGWKELHIGLEAVGTNTIKCYQVDLIHGVDSSIASNTTFQACAGYLSVSQGTEHQQDYLIVNKHFELLNITEIYEQNDNTKYLTLNFIAK